MSPPLFKDLNKTAKNIQEDDYSLKRTLKVKHTTPNGVGVTTKNEHKDGVVGTIEAKYAHKPSGVSIDKLTLRGDGEVAMEASMVGLATGMKCLIKTDQSLKGEIGVESKGDIHAVRADVCNQGSYVKASGTVCHGPAVLGGALNYAMGAGTKPAELKDFAGGASFSGAGWGASFTATSKLKTFNASAFYQYQPNITGSVLASTTPDKSLTTYSVGALYKCNPKTTLRAKVDSSAVVTAVATQSCADKVLVSLTAQVDKDVSPKFGVMCTLG